MEANVGDQIRHIYDMGSTSLNPMGKRTLEWDLNDWKWDGELFVATPVNCKPSSYRSHQFLPETGVSSNSSSTCSDDVNMESDGREPELLQSIRGVVGENGEAGNLSLKLGGHGGQGGEMDVMNWDAGSGKRSKTVGVGGANRSVCQVEDCGADLSKAKDYHRRHKVCEMHSKATRALVGNVMQRFCQQCSRFHALQEFDEGKRSCRRRLAGHNKRRRKTNPLNVVPGTSISDDQSNSYLLLTLLKILADLHSNKSDHTKNQDLLSHLLRSLVENKSANGGNNISEAVSALLSNGQQGLPNSGEQLTKTAVHEMPLEGSPSADISPPPSTLISTKDSPPSYSVAPSAAVGRIKPNNFDLNDVYVDSDDGTEDLEAFHIPSNNGTSSPGCPSWMQLEVHNSSPPQVSRNSDSGSAQSPLSSSRGDQIRTDRIVFKLFGKEPSDFPLVLRTQILDWLAHTPTDIESYIRPGCIVLTIYLRLAEFVWDELCLDLTSSLSRLVDFSEDSFWSTGWVYVRVQDQVAFIYNGHVVIDATLPYTSTASRILSVKPIAIPVAEKVSFSIKGFNVSPPNSRLLCALEGQYLALENIPESPEASSSHNSSDKRQVVNYSCSIPTIVGRGFIEVEDKGLGNDFYPFIVAESDICSEIRMLESTLELKWTDTDEMSKNGKLDAQSEAIEFIQEMGWLLHRTQMRSKLDYADRTTDEIFDFDRLKWLIEFALDHEWCAVVKKLLNIVFDGTVGSGEHESVVAAVADIGILHRAVRRNSRPLVELLLRYVPEGKSSNSVVKEGHFLFTPSATGPAGLTPLHIGAGRDGAEAVLDALTDDPEMVGIEAWKNARDSTGASPEDYARLRGHYSYIHLVQRKISKKSVIPSHVVLDIPNTLISDSKPNKTDTTATQKSTFQIAKFPMRTGLGPCKICEQKLIFRTVNTSMAYKPAMLSMVVTVAAVCVCVALLFKSCPEVLYVFHPFRWENLEYGSS